MLFQKSRHASTLPTRLTAHQVLDAAGDIHDLVKGTVEPLLESQPYYQTFMLILDSVDRARLQLEESLNKRRYKSPISLRGIGGLDGLSGVNTLSAQKLAVYEQRRKAMVRLRSFINLHQQDQERPEMVDAANTLGNIIVQRMPGFEKLSYAESNAEFKLLLADMSIDPSVDAALTALDLTSLYSELQAYHEAFQQIHMTQTLKNHESEESPKVTLATREMRRAMRVLLTNMHFDIENGNPTFKPVLGHVDEIIDKVGSVAETRKTLSEKEKAKTQGQNDQGQQDQDQNDQNDQNDQSNQDDQTGQTATTEELQTASVAPNTDNG